MRYTVAVKLIGALRSFFRRLTLAQQFMLASLVILVSGMLGLGAWIGSQIENGVVQGTAGTTALYVDSQVEPLLQELDQSAQLAPDHQQQLDWLLHQSPLAKDIVMFKVWNREGRIVYSSDSSLIGQQFELDSDLTSGFDGKVSASLSDLGKPENVAERRLAGGRRLLEMYTPVRLRGTEQIIAVAEFYERADALEGELAGAQQQSWLIVAAATAGMYLLLGGFVQRASNMIGRQRGELAVQVSRLTELLAQNAELHERVQRAATRTTTLHERILRRIGAELHDGPAQDLGLALLRLDHVGAGAGALTPGSDLGTRAASDLDIVQHSVGHALQEVRAISAGMGLPELNPLSLAETLARVVRTHERRTHTRVQVRAGPLPEQAPLSLKITLYRVVQEALGNAFRHAGGAGQQVELDHADGWLRLTVADAGPGFDVSREQSAEEHLGLAGMRERVESLGGTFSIASQSGRGTRIVALLPAAGGEKA